MNPFDENTNSDRPADPTSIAENGDDRLIDAILRGRATDTPSSLDERMRRLMGELDERPLALRPHSARTLSGWVGRAPVLARTLAACLLLTTAIGLLLLSERPVLADPGLLERAIERLNEGDSSYLIQINPESDAPDESHPAERGGDAAPATRDDRAHLPAHPGRRAMQWRKDAPPARRHPGGKSIQRLDGAMLHIRGDEAVFLIELPGDRVLARGFKGNEFWSNFKAEETDRLLVETATPNGPRPDRRLSNLLRFATLDLAEMLDGLERHYAVSGPELVQDGEDGPTLVRHLAVASEEQRPGRNGLKRPRSIEIWTDPESERIVELRLEGAAPGSSESIDVTMTLQSTNSLDDAIFDPAAYETVRPRRRSPITERRSR